MLRSKQTLLSFNLPPLFDITNGIFAYATQLNDNIWEFRTLYKNKTYRLFSFWDRIEDKKTLVVATHGILKKRQKTPGKEIKKAEKIREQYLEKILKNK